MATSPKCACGCGQRVKRSGARGPAPRYSSHACRMRVFRRRHRGEFRPVGDPPAPPTVVIRAHHSDEQVARAVLEARALGFAFSRLGVEARPEFAWRCEQLAGVMQAALAELFPDGQVSS